MTFDIISIAYIVIAFLFLFVGLSKGFLGTIISLVKGIASLVISIFCCTPLAKFFMTTPIGDKLSSLISMNFFKEEIYNQTITSANKDSVLKPIIEQLNLPSFLNNLILKLSNNFIEVGEGSFTVGEVLTKSFTFYALVAISFILLFIIIRIIASLLNKVFKGISTLPIAGMVNKLLGGILYLALGIVVICLISYGLSAVKAVSATLSDWLTKTMQLDREEATSISKYIYFHNPLGQIFTKIQELFIK